MRWPGHVPAGTQINELFSSEDWLPTLVVAAGGPPDLVEQCKLGFIAGDKTFKVHLDGYDQTPLLTGKGKSPRNEFFYFGDDGELLAVRHGRFKLVFEEQDAKGIEMWGQPFVSRRAPLIFDLKADPLERGQDSTGYSGWLVDHAFMFVPAQQGVAKFLSTFREFPPRQHPASFSVDQVVAKLENASSAPVH